jgi:FlaA1/EpsC-like NDP-sugar epimerase
MIKKFFLKNLDRYTSKWIVLIIDLSLVCISFILAYFIRFNTSFEFNYKTLLTQLPVVFMVSLISFLTVGSYKGIIRHTGIRDAFNVFLATLLIALLMISIV